MRSKYTIASIPYVDRLLVIAFILLVSACTTQTARNTDRDVTATVDQLINQFRQAEKQASPEKDRLLLTIAASLAKESEYDLANDAIQEIDSSLLSDSEYMSYTLVASDIFTERQQLLKAQALLDETRLNQLWDQYEIENQRVLRMRRAQLFSQLGNLEASINERVTLSTILLPGEQDIENQEMLWQSLTSLSLEQLQRLATTTSSILQGWYQLALINKQYQHDLETQNIAISEWVAANPNHPASYQLPKDLQLLQELINQRPQHIALLLPVQGKLAKAARAISDGFFAAYYYVFNKEQHAPLVSVFDTSSENIDLLYDRAVANGAELIIGPLSKDNVAALGMRANLPVATLALNYLEEPASTQNVLQGTQSSVDSQANPIATASIMMINRELEEIDEDIQANAQLNNLFQFGLSSDREAVQAAERAWSEGHRTASIIAPDADWSARIAQAFMEKWQSLGGKVVNYRDFGSKDNYSTVVQSLLNIDKSQQRANALKSLTSRSFEFEPRRRADIDMIFLVARTQQARQIKPALAFYYAGDIPVYSTSQVFSNTSKDIDINDLNNIRFVTMPWVIDGSTPSQQSIEEKFNVSGALGGLYAMGADTFLLSNRLRQLQQAANITLYGATGQLQLSHNNRIVRTQPWAEIYKGQIRPLADVIMDYRQDSTEKIQ